MYISRLKIKNWRNFREAETDSLIQNTYVLGPNAAGKSNLLDVLRFLRDVAKTKGGGLQEAIALRGGVSKLRCLHARNDTEVLIELDISDDSAVRVWTYSLGFNIPSKGAKEPVVTREVVVKFPGSSEELQLLSRPQAADNGDPLRLRQTHLEQINTNKDFRDLVDFLGQITYVHLVPQLLKFGDQIGGNTVDNDPFGQEFMLRIARTTEKTRNARLKRIETGLQTIVPHLEDLKYIKDELSGRPHLEIKFKHHRPRGAKQREDQFSDGTLRLISLLWLIQEPGDAPVLLEEPELSLNEDVVRSLPLVFNRIQRKLKNPRQLIVTTHSTALLDNPGINARGVVVVVPTNDGSTLDKPTEAELRAVGVGLSVADAILPRARGIDGHQIQFEF